MVDLFLVAEKAGHGFDGDGRVPEVDCEVVACSDQAFGDLVIRRRGGFEALFCFFQFLCVCGWDGAGMIVVSGAKDEFCG